MYGNATGKYDKTPKVGKGESATESLGVYTNQKFSYSDNAWSCGDSNIKYWPNPSKKENGDVVPAYVSFFAYAPYAGSASAGDFSTDGTWGIMGWNLVYDLIHTSNGIKTDDVSKSIINISYRDVDPVIHYSATKGTDGKMVDLLWGTAGTNGNTYDDKEQEGSTISGDNGQNTEVTGAGAVNIDLQKMKSGGKVGFNFKHALAKLGGLGGVYADVKGKESGATGNDVAIRWIAIELTNTSKSSDDKALNIPTEGYFNLATGKWATVQSPVADGSTQVPMVYFIDGSTKDFEAGNGKEYKYHHFGQTDLTKNLTGVTEEQIKALQDNTIFCNGGDDFYGSGFDFFDEVSGYQSSGSLSENPKPLLNPEGTTESSTPFYFIPDGNNVSIKANVIVNWQVGINNYATQSAEVNIPDLAANTAYKLYIHLDVKSIKVDAAVAKWDDYKDKIEVTPEPVETTTSGTGE